MTWRNIFNDLRQWFRAIQYPTCIFCRSTYKDIICMSELLECVPAVSARKVKKSIESEDFHGVKILSVMPFERHEVINLSMNLMGACWKKDYIHFFDKSGKKKSDFISPLLYVIFHPYSVKFDNDGDIVYVNLRVLHNHDFEYPLKFSNEIGFCKFFNRYPNKDDCKYVKNEETRHRAKCIISHDPTLLNYWHLVLDIDMGDGVLLNKDGQYRKIVTAFWNMLLRKAIFVEEPNSEEIAIPQRMYKK